MKIDLYHNKNLVITWSEERHYESIVRSEFKNENLGFYMKVFPPNFHSFWGIILPGLSQNILTILKYFKLNEAFSRIKSHF